MTILHRSYPWKRWPDTVFVVKRWHPGYRYFNLIFARWWMPIEMMIVEEGFLP